VFSFYPSKNVGAAGDGGLVATDDDALADLVAALRDHGQTKKLYDHPMVGTNSRMDEVQAAVLRRKLPRVEAWTSARRAIAARYDAAFRGTPVRTQRVLPGSESAWHLYTVRVERRDEVREALRNLGVDTGIYYPVPLHRQSCFERFRPAPCPVSDRLATEVLSLPCFPGLEPGEQDAVVAAMLDAVGTA
jgi:dTDP-4-amino-4,6-dideoxygalactose transaminase